MLRQKVGILSYFFQFGQWLDLENQNTSLGQPMAEQRPGAAGWLGKP